MKCFCSGLRAFRRARTIETPVVVGSRQRETFNQLAKASGLTLVAVALAACGGGGGGDTTSTPPPPPPPATYTIGGTVSGLTGSGLVLQNNGGNNLTVAANATTFTFTTAVNSGSAYAVTVATQPSGQTCTVASGSGTATANVTNVAVSCTTTATFTIGGTVTGLTGSGLVLQDNGGDNLPVSSGTFTFATKISSGSAYAVTVATQPVGQTCAVAAGSGTATANVTNVAVTCSAAGPSKVTIGGAVTGLTGSGLVLTNNGGDSLPVSAAGNFTFATALTTGSQYVVIVATQPSGQTCTVSNGTGIAAANVTNISVACAAGAAGSVSIGGTVSGLTGSGLVLQDNKGDNLPVSANGSFVFATKVATGAAYTVTVLTQPSAPNQSCAVSSGSGNAPATNVANVGVVCRTIGQVAFTANNGDKTLSTYSINPATGVLTPTPGGALPVGAAPAAVSLAPNGKFAFSATDNGDKIYAYTVNSTTGALTAVAGSPFTTPFTTAGHPFPDIAVDPQSKFLYLASLNDGLVAGFAIDPNTGVLTKTPNSPYAAGAGAGAIPAFSPDGKFLYVMNQNAASVSGYAVNGTTGELTAIAGSPFSTGAAGATPTWIVFTPNGKFAYVSNSGTTTPSPSANTVQAYSVDANGVLTAITAAGGLVNTDQGPADLTIDSNGTHLYVPAKTQGTVATYSIDSTTGVLAMVSDVPAPGSPQLVVIEPTGHYAYVSASTGNRIWGYSIDPTKGTLATLSGSPFPAGSNPLFVNIDPSGKFLYTANNLTGGISGYTINLETGALTAMAGSPFATGVAPFVVSISPELPGIRD